MSADQDAIWYYSIDEVSYGPVSRKELLAMIASGKLKPHSYVWRSGFGSKWHQLYEVEELDVHVNLEGTYGDNTRKSGDPVFSVPVTPGILSVAGDAYRWMTKALFRKFNLLTWIIIAFTFWLGATGSSVISLDTRYIKDCSDIADSHFGTILLCLRETQNYIFDKVGIVTWGITMLLFTLFTSFFKVRGRLMSLHLLHFPHDPLRSAWKRTKGITRSLVYFYAVIDVLEAFFVSVSLWKLLNLLGTETLARGLLTSLWLGISSTTGAMRLFIGGLSLFLVLELTKSLAYHFAEPIVYGRGVSILVALRAAFRFCGYNFLTTVKFYLFLLFFNLLFVSVLITIVMLLCYALVLCGINNVQTVASVLTFIVLPGKLLLLPVYYFIRGLGPKILGVL